VCRGGVVTTPAHHHPARASEPDEEEGEPRRMSNRRWLASLGAGCRDSPRIVCTGGQKVTSFTPRSSPTAFWGPEIRWGCPSLLETLAHPTHHGQPLTIRHTCSLISLFYKCINVLRAYCEEKGHNLQDSFGEGGSHLHLSKPNLLLPPLSRTSRGALLKVARPYEGQPERWEGVKKSLYPL
jgi:hypothetical protein